MNDLELKEGPFVGILGPQIDRLIPTNGKIMDRRTVHMVNTPSIALMSPWETYLLV